MNKNLPRRLQNVIRNCGVDFVNWYLGLPEWSANMVIRCPTKNSDGTPIATDDVRGCGSSNVGWDGREMYDCYSCGIFFTDHAADPPHRVPGRYDE